MKQLKRSASAVLLAVMLATIMGCAATPTTESTGEYVDDAVITTKVKAAILDQPSLKSSEISVETYKGTVYLRGVVASQATINEAVGVARSVDGVTSVKNDMRVM
jgi:hyperosmotically inducible protein